MKKRACLLWGTDQAGGEILSEYFQPGAISQGYEVSLQAFAWDDLPDLAVLWGYREPIPTMVELLREKGVEVLIVEAGFLNRGAYYSVGVGRLNWIPDDAPGDRFKKLKIKRIAKRQKGEHVLLCGQQPGDSQHNLDRRELAAWIREAIASLRRHSDREIVYRPHPGNSSREGPLINPPGVDRYSDPEGPLYGELKDCHALVSYNSTAALYALLAGVPVFSDPSAFYGEISTHELDRIERPRWRSSLSFFNRLAYGQWSTGELKTGAPLEYINSLKEPTNGKETREKGASETGGPG